MRFSTNLSICIVNCRRKFLSLHKIEMAIGLALVVPRESEAIVLYFNFQIKIKQCKKKAQFFVIKCKIVVFALTKSAINFCKRYCHFF